MLTFWVALILMLAFPQQNNPTPEQQAQIAAARVRGEEYRRQAIELNTLAGEIHSEADARKLVDAVAEMFAKELPPAWATAGIRRRVAHAEYEAVSDPARLISEEAVAHVWNQYVQVVGAPDEAQVTPAEIHWMRDQRFTIGKLAWARQTAQTIWTAPNVYPVGPDGKVTSGCRPLEVLRLFWDLDNVFDNMRRAREQMKTGVLTSDRLKQQLEHPTPPPKTRAVLTVATVMENPVQKAESRYIQERGWENYSLLLERLFNELIPD